MLEENNVNILSEEFNKRLKQKMNDLKYIDEKKEIEITQEIISELKTSLKNELTKNISSLIQENKARNLQFCERNYRRWQPAFDLLEAFIQICIESGEKFNKLYRPIAVKSKDIVFDLLVRQHARACQIAQEILSLMKSGYADGAYARWRALHEVTVIAIFIKKHGQESAERFYWYDIIESFKLMNKFKIYDDRLQQTGPTDSELKEYENLYNFLKDKYGKGYTKDYGWALHLFKKEQLNFTDLEKDVKLDHWRPYYKWACQNIHAGPKGINKKLGLCDTSEELLLVGSSDSGMSIPGHHAAISLAIITSSLLNIEPNVEVAIILKIIEEMEKEIGEVFDDCDREKIKKK
ncbi:MAG: hypothetical protein JXN63_08740 [Candidatus Delongbacteria bacterium]|nr:hypothetical protein [Candidatus Delongbacteria bacterium]